MSPEPHDDDEGVAMVALTIPALSKQLIVHERDDRRALKKIEKRLRTIENRVLVIGVLVLGSGVSSHLPGLLGAI